MIPLVLAAVVSITALPPPQEPPPEKDVPKPEDVRIGGDERQRYFIHRPGEAKKDPPGGWRLLVVLPGGDGSAEFAPFVGRIRENALGEEWVIAQIVAPKWTDDQAASSVWPTKLNPWPKMRFPSEQLFDAVLEDIGKKMKVDPRYIFTLSWSSSGTLAYTLALTKKTRVTGSFIAMSVYKPGALPPLEPAKDRRFYILHSPGDKVCPPRMAEQARDELTKAGAVVEYATYEGGHGWHGDVFGEIRKGVDWLAAKAEQAPGRKSKK
jgi:poly(3-hydroxybutyrate) depolymerase